MPYKASDFIQFPVDSPRVIANMEAAYEQWVDAQRELASMPVSMYWQAKGSADYLAVKMSSNDPGSTVGVRSEETESTLARHVEAKEALKARVAQADALILERAAVCRALRIPSIADKQAQLLRELDKYEVLRNDVLVVGTNAFIAYSIACNARFPAGVEETEDFDLAWCRDSNVSLSRMVGNQAQHAGVRGASPSRPSVFEVLRKVDSSYSINKRKPYQAVNSSGYEVELLAAPSLAPLPKGEPFEPMVTLEEQEWLLQGRPLSVVSPTVRGRACPLYVPDPRWMALHKLWLSTKPERNALKKPKDARQGEVLLSACRYFLADTYPMDLDFVFDLPPVLRDVFNTWAQANEFDPNDPAAVASFDAQAAGRARGRGARPR